jgi:hypothetical protein
MSSNLFLFTELFTIARLPNVAHPRLGSDGAVDRYCPVPDKYTVWGVFLASSFTTILAVLVPTSLGVKVTVIVQLIPYPRVFGLIGQLFV